MTSYQTYQPSSSFYVPSHPSSSQRLSLLPPSQASSSSYHHRYQSHSSFFSRLDQIQELGGRVAFRIPGTERFHRPLVGHAGCVNALCWSESGEMLASGSDDTRVVLWKVGTSHIHPTANERAPQRYLPYSSRATAGQNPSSRSVPRTTHAGGDEDADDDVDGPLPSPDHPLLEMGMASVIQTGHTANIFSVAFAPHSSDSRIFTAAGDATMRVFDIGSSSSGMGTRVSHPDGRWYDRFDQGSGGVNCRVLKCHRRRVKRLATENSPDIFLSVGEDGDVRSTDLRTSHTCRTNCPRPLLHSFTSLYSLSLSKLQPYLFAVAGESPYTYLYDRRMIGRVIKDEWGMSMTNSDEALLTKCVRRYGLPQGSWDGDCSVQDEFARRPTSRTSHITAVKISEHNGNDLIATYSNGAIYRFGIRDEEGGLHHVQDRLPDGWEGGTTAARTGGSKASGRERKRGSSSSSSGFPAIPENAVANETVRSSAAGKRSNQVVTGPQAEDAARRLPPPTVTRSSQHHNAVAARTSQRPSEQDWRRAFVDEEEEDDDENITSGSDSPTEQEAQGFPLYQQLLADGEAGSLDMSSSSSSSEASSTSVQEEEEGDSAEWEDVDSDGQAPPRRRRREPNWFNDPEVDDLVIDSDEDSDDDDGEEDDDEDGDDDDDDEEDSFSDSEEDSISSSDPDPDVDDPQYAQNVRQASHNYVPIVYPRNPRYVGHLNSETVKEVNFLGPHDEYIVSGSDDGNFFIWDKASGELLGIWEGDGSVVNVVVPHPTLPVLAVSGIDDTVKLFGPVSRYTAGHSTEKGSKDLRTMSRMADKDAIVERNTFRHRRSRGMFGMGGDDNDDVDDDEDDLEGAHEREAYAMRSALQTALMRASMAGVGGAGEDGDEHPQLQQCGPM